MVSKNIIKSIFKRISQIFIGCFQVTEDVGFDLSACEVVFTIGFANKVNPIFGGQDLGLGVNQFVLNEKAILDCLVYHGIEFLDLIVSSMNICDFVVFDNQILNWFVVALNFLVVMTEGVSFIHILWLMIKSAKGRIS